MKQIGHFLAMIGKGLLGLTLAILRLTFSIFRRSFRKMPMLTSILVSGGLGFVIGSFLGVSTGVAFGGNAVNGAVIFGPIGAIIGVLFGPWVAGTYKAFRKTDGDIK